MKKKLIIFLFLLLTLNSCKTNNLISTTDDYLSKKPELQYSNEEYIFECPNDWVMFKKVIYNHNNSLGKKSMNYPEAEPSRYQIRKIPFYFRRRASGN